jgi:hypothetical protein
MYVPIPFNATFCGLPAALSVIEIEPVSVPIVVGVKVTLIVQLEPGLTLLPHVFVWANGLLAAMLVIFRIPRPVLVRWIGSPGGVLDVVPMVLSVPGWVLAVFIRGYNSGESTLRRTEYRHEHARLQLSGNSCATSCPSNWRSPLKHKEQVHEDELLSTLA